MNCLLSRAVIARRAMLVLAAFPVIAGAADVRIVTYNTQDDVGTGGDTGPVPTSVLPYLETVIEGIGQQQYAGDGILKLPDIIALQETTSNSATVTPIVSALNTYYGNPGLFNSSSYQATTSDGNTYGGGPNALIYNQTTLNLNASIGVGTPQSGTNGEFRQVVRYQFQPLVDKGTNTGFFYVYDTHMKSGSASTSADGSTDGALRNGEAQIIRNDEATNLPANAAVLYMGDFNMDGTTETAYQTMTTTNSPGGIAQGAGIDPLNPTNVTTTWGSGNVGILTEKDTELEYRDDLQLLTANVYNGSSSALDYVSGSLHAFGNNGTVAYENNINTSGNTALNDINSVTRGSVLPGGSLTSSQVLAAENANLGSDHLPVVSDYTVAGFNNGIWTGGTGNWNNFTFWTNEVVPNSNTIEVKIDNGNSIASVVTLNQNATVEDLTLDANDSLIISSGYTLVLSGPNASLLNGTTNSPGSITASTTTNTGNFTTSGLFTATANFTNSGTFTTSGGFTSMGVFTNSGTFFASDNSFVETGNFNNSGSASFGGKQNWSAGTVFTNTAGTAVFSTDAGSASALNLSVNVSGGLVTFSSTQHLASLNIAGGALVKLTSTGTKTVLVTSSLTVNGTLDLTNNYLDVIGGNLATITASVGQGYNAGAWNGSGITSSTAAGNTAYLTALGVIQNNQSGSALFTSTNTFDGITPGASDILVKYTYYGDANLDGKVDGSDYSLTDNGYLSGLTGWYNGDFNYDGVVNGSDYTLIDNAFNSQGSKILTAFADPTSIPTAQLGGVSPVPEAGSFFLAAMGLPFLLGRRRSSHLGAVKR